MPTLSCLNDEPNQSVQNFVGLWHAWWQGDEKLGDSVLLFETLEVEVIGWLVNILP